ncbi:MAG: TlpA disulfide reductase family protein [Pseudomonadota bacterium]
MNYSFFSSGKRLYFFALALGACAGLGLLLVQNPARTESCNVSPKMQAALQAAAKGDVAALIIEKSPRKIPNFSYVDQSGKAQVFSPAKRITLLNFWATWCVPCREEMPALDQLQKERGGTQFSVLPVSLDAGRIDKPKKFYFDTKIAQLPLLHDGDGKIFQTFRKAGLLTGLPASFLINQEGCILGTLAGPADWASKDALALIDAALKN